MKEPNGAPPALSPRRGVALPAALLVGVLTVAWGGCGIGESGIAPPTDRIFLPTGIAIDPSSAWLYVVNSNSDLRYNTGTVAPVDLRKVAEDRARRDWQACPTLRHVPTGAFSGRFCCHDLDDPAVLNCDDRGYVAPAATVRIGSFGGPIVLQCGAGPGTCRDEDPRRLFVGVRSDPSITYIDARVRSGGVALRCTGPLSAEEPPANQTCDKDWRLEKFDGPDGEQQLAEEPLSLALDATLGVLYVGHLFNGVTAVDVCASRDRRPSVAFELPRVFSDLRQGVTSLTVTAPGNPAAPVYVTGRVHLYNFPASAEVQQLYIKGAQPGTCGPDGQAFAKRDIGLVPAGGFYSSAFHPESKEMRGAILAPDGRRLLLLHRNGDRRANPAALVGIELPTSERTTPADVPGPGAPAPGTAPGVPPGSYLVTPNRAVDVLEICAGPMEMKLHDTGRGPRVFIVCYEAGQVYVVDPQLFTVTGIINAGRGPTNLSFSASDRTVAYLTEFIDNDVAVIDLKPGSPTEYRVVQRIGFPRASGR